MLKYLILTLLMPLLFVAAPAPANAGTDDPGPAWNGGCDEAFIAPHSDYADQCRARGWTIHVAPKGRGIIVSPHKVVRYLWLPQCQNEDGSGQRSACTWNMTLPYQGDGRGLAYWMDRRDRPHYVKRTLPQQQLQG